MQCLGLVSFVPLFVPVALALAVTTGGCSQLLQTVEKPTATVRDVSVGAVGFDGVRGEMRLDVMNPNGFGVPLSGVQWELAIGGARAVTGNVELAQTIPAKAIAPVATSLSITATDAMMVASALSAGARDYRVRARLTFSTRLGPITVEVDHAGKLGGGGHGYGGILGTRDR